MNTQKTLLSILVEELPKRGGWPEGAVCATQDQDGEVFFSESATPVFGFFAWHDGDWCGNEFHTITAIDYATAIITRDQYEAELAAKNDGWIEWAGGECPLEYGTVVDVKDRDGFLWYSLTIGEHNTVDNIFWQRGICGRPDNEIIAYRLHQPQEAEQDESCDEADLNDCIGQALPVPARWQLLADIHAAGIKIDLESAVFLADYLIDAGYRKQ